MNKNSKGESTTFLDFRQYYKATVVKHCGNDIKRDILISGTEKSPQINPHSQFIFEKGANNIQWGKQNYIQQVVLGKLDSHM